MSAANWGIFRGAYNGHGIYWAGTYNVEGIGEFHKLCDARNHIDIMLNRWKEEEKAVAKKQVENGAIACRRDGDSVTVALPTGTVTVSIRDFRQNVFAWEKQYGKECVWL